MSSKIEYVLDSAAVIALPHLKPGYQRVAEVLLRPLELQVIDWTEAMAYRSAAFTQFNKSHGLSLGDRACLTLAKQLRATAVTSDRAWRRLPSVGVRIMIFR